MACSVVATASAPACPPLEMESSTPAPECAAGQQGGHERCGTDWWHEQRAHWRRNSLSELAASSDSSPAGGHTVRWKYREPTSPPSSLSEQQRLNLRGVLCA